MKVKMKFEKDMFYTDPVNPIYRAGEVYEVDDQDKGMIARWVKRGGIIVTADTGAIEKKAEKIKAEKAEKKVEAPEKTDNDDL